MLESLGCAVMRDGVYLLPDTAQNRRSLSSLCEHVTRATGTADMLCVTASDTQQATQFRQLFDRSAKYNSLALTIQSLKTGFGVSDPAAISRVLAKQRREFEAIATLDFFPSAAQQTASKALADAEREVRALMFPEAPSGDAQGSRSQAYLQRSWATRLPLWADRLASAWLIRRFIDNEAMLVWLDKSQPIPRGVVAFGFEGAVFSNSQTEITFERLLKHFALDKNTALTRMGLLVHYLEAGGSPVAEAAGVETLLQGARRRAMSENELLAESEKTFDLLYHAYSEAPGSS